MTTAIILSGGGNAPTNPLPQADLVVAADSGLVLAEELGLTPDVVVGDMDSVADDLLQRVASDGAEILRHPTSKDATDLELAIDVAIERGHDTIVVVGGGIERLDHLLANVALLAAERFSDRTMAWRAGTATVTVVRDSHTLSGVPGDVVTLLAVGGPATVTTDSLRWPLVDEALLPGSTRGVSNELTEPKAGIHVTEGTLLVVEPR